MTSRRQPGLSRRVFVDSSASFALKAVNDTNHPIARTLAYQLIETRRRLFTTNLVVAETHALMLNRLGYLDALSWLLDMIESPGTTILANRVEAEPVPVHPYMAVSDVLCDRIDKRYYCCYICTMV